jgi:hypothetical protein
VFCTQNKFFYNYWTYFTGVKESDFPNAKLTKKITQLLVSKSTFTGIVLHQGKKDYVATIFIPTIFRVLIEENLIPDSRVKEVSEQLKNFKISKYLPDYSKPKYMDNIKHFMEYVCNPRRSMPSTAQKEIVEKVKLLSLEETSLMPVENQENTDKSELLKEVIFKGEPVCNGFATSGPDDFLMDESVEMEILTPPAQRKTSSQHTDELDLSSLSSDDKLIKFSPEKPLKKSEEIPIPDDLIGLKFGPASVTSISKPLISPVENGLSTPNKSNYSNVNPEDFIKSFATNSTPITAKKVPLEEMLNVSDIEETTQNLIDFNTPKMREVKKSNVTPPESEVSEFEDSISIINVEPMKTETQKSDLTLPMEGLSLKTEIIKNDTKNIVQLNLEVNSSVKEITSENGVELNKSEANGENGEKSEVSTAESTTVESQESVDEVGREALNEENDSDSDDESQIMEEFFKLKAELDAKFERLQKMQQKKKNKKK